MANDLEKIAEAFRILATVKLPAGYAQDGEMAFLCAHLEATKIDRAKHLLATRGRREAAALMGCSEAQIYRLANMRIGFPETSAEIESAA